MTEHTNCAEELDAGGLTERGGRVCTFHYRSGNKQLENSVQQQQQQQQQQRLESASRAMPSSRGMPSYEEWKRRKANKPFGGGQEVVLLELDPKEELARRKTRDQRLMSMMNNEEQDKYYTYLDHQERLQTKVQRDREAREQRKAEEAARLAEEKKRRSGEHKLRKRLEKVALTTDSQFVSDVAKSKYYRLVQREQRQQFRSREEQDAFWQSHLQSQGLLRGESRRAETADADWNDDQLDADGAPHLVWEKTEDALQLGGGVGDPEAVGGPSKSRGGGGFHGMSRAQQSRMLDELFPRVERPKLTSFDVDYAKKEEKSAEELELERLQQRRRRRLEDWREHRHMQQMAVTFGVTTRRILDERPVRDSADRLMDDTEGGGGDLGQLFGEALDRAHRRQAAAATAGESRELDLTDPRLLQPWRKPAGRRRRSGRSQGGGDTYDDWSSMSGVGAAVVDRPLASPATQNSNESTQRRSDQQPPLLSLADAHRELPLVEAKGQSTLWNNYMGAGNVRFAPLNDDQWYREKTSTIGAPAAATTATS